MELIKKNNDLYIRFDADDYNVHWKEFQKWLLKNGGHYNSRKKLWQYNGNRKKLHEKKKQLIDDPTKELKAKYSKARNIYWAKKKAGLY